MKVRRARATFRTSFFSDVEPESAKGRGCSAARELEQTIAGEKRGSERRAGASHFHGVRDAGKLYRSRWRDQDLRPKPGGYGAARARGDLLRSRGIFGPQQPG